MRSQPLRNARIITKWTNTELEYLGEWTHPKNGERWVCVRRNAYSETGWIFGRYIEFIPNAVIQADDVIKNSTNKTSTKQKSKVRDGCDGDTGLQIAVITMAVFVCYIIYKKDKQENEMHNQEANTDIIDIISPYFKYYSRWEIFGPDEAFYEVMRTAPLFDVLEVLQHIDFTQPERLYWIFKIDNAAYKNPHMFVSGEVSRFLSQFL